MEKLFFVTILAFVLMSCSKQNTKQSDVFLLRHTKVKTIHIELPDILRKHTAPIFIKQMAQIKIHDTDYVAISFSSIKSGIFFYNLISRKYTYFVSSITNRNVNFLYENEDTIILFSHEGKYYNYDSAIFIKNIYDSLLLVKSVNLKNFITSDKYCFQGDSFNLTRGKADSAAFIRSVFAAYFSKPQKLYFNVYNSISYNLVPFLAYYDIDDNSLKYVNKLKHPFVKNDSEMNIFFSWANIFKLNEENMLISFYYTPKALIYNVIKDKVEDTVFFFSTYKNSNSLYKENTLNGYNSVNDTASSYFIFPLDNGHFLRMFYHGTFKIKVWSYYNEKYKLLAENVIKYPSANHQFFVKDTDVLVYLDGDSLELDFYKLTVDSSKTINVRDKIDSVIKQYMLEHGEKTCSIFAERKKHKKPILQYLRKMGITDSSFAVIITSYDGCGSCNQTIFDLLRINMNFLEYKKPYLYLIHIYPEYSIKRLKKTFFHLGFNDFRFIKFDTTYNYAKYEGYRINNPRIIIVKNNKLVKDTMYMPSETYLINNDILKMKGVQVIK